VAAPGVALGSAPVSIVWSVLGSALGVALGAALEVVLGAELEVALGVAPIRGMMVSKKRRIPARWRQLAAMDAGSLRRSKANLLFDGAGVRVGSQLQGFA